ncbi:MAG: fused MFS/spermidine synthase [Chloroflexi bacterium]|nr:fused MFS/spermidine synthase [Chloroflexota bacterium]
MKSFRIEPVVLAWFFFSGMAALIYQVIWARELELVFGSTLYAVSTILSVFMAGLALGSIIFGKIADRQGAPLRMYGLIELGIGIYALLTPLAFKLLAVIQQSLPDFLRGSSAGFNPFSFIFSFVILIIPTTFMGGTLPILSKTIVRNYQELGAKVSTLYFINTLGAAFGAFLAGFVLIGASGMMAATFVAAFVNVAVGASAMWVQRLVRPAEGPASGLSAAESTAAPGHNSISKPMALTLLIGYGFAGFAALGLEVLWTRVLALVIGSSVYAFSLMLVAILMGIAVGSLIGVRVVDRARNLWLWFAAIEIALGIAVVLITPILGEAQLFFFDIFLNYQESYNLLLFVEFAVIFLILMVPTTMMGLAFPVASKIYARDLKHLAAHVGDIYASNTIGAIVGPLAVSFLLIPLMGIQKSILQLSWVYMAIGVAIMIGILPRKSVARTILPIGLAVVIVVVNSLVPAWNKLVVTSGVYYQMGSYYDPTGKASARELMTNRTLLFYKEGQLATVSVAKGRGQKVLTINGKVDASTSTDLGTQLLVAHMPLLLHKEPKKVLGIGLGSGITLGAILKHAEVERVDMVEIEPAVVDAARYFAEENNNALEDPRTNIIVNDGRNFIISTTEKYDVISAEPSNPWVSHSSTMFSREVFELYKKIINDDGVVMQWFHLYRMGNDDLRMIINTFVSVFPHTTLWGKANSPDIILIGGLKPLTIDFGEFNKKIQVPAIARDLARINSADPFQMLNYFLMDEQNLSRYAGSYPVNTDDRPRLEFSAPRNLYASTVGLNMESMNGYRTTAEGILTGVSNPVVAAKIQTDYQARERAIQAQIYRDYGYWDRAAREWEASLAINPLYPIARESYSEALEALGDYAWRSGDTAKASYDFTRAAELTPERASPRVNLGLLALATDQAPLAIIHLSEALGKDPSDSWVSYNLGNAYSQIGENQKAWESYTKAIVADPSNAQAYANRGSVTNRMGRMEEALNDYAMALNISPGFAGALIGRGLMYYDQRNYAQALIDFSRAVRLEPTANNYDFKALALIGIGQYDEAYTDLLKATQIDPVLPLPWYRLGFIHEKKGQRSEALAAYRRFISLSRDQEMLAEANAAIARLQ